MSESPISERLAAHDAAVADAWERRQRAWRRRQNEFEVSVDATADLTAYRDQVRHRQRVADLDEQRTLTRALCERVQRAGLVFETAGTGGTLVVRDPRVMSDLEDARSALDTAKRARAEFLHVHGAEVDAERKHAEMDRIREALDGEDPARLREALVGV